MATEQLDLEALQTALETALKERRREAVRTVLRQLPPDEAADILIALPPPDLATAVALLGTEALAHLLKHTPAVTAARLLDKLGRAQAADVLEEMDPDDATDVVEELEPSEAEAILVEMEPSEAEEIRELLQYPPHSVGGRMTPEFVAITPHLTVDEALAVLRRVAAEAETIYYVYVVDAQDRLLGVLSMRDLVLARPGARVQDVMVREPIKVRATDDQEVAARLLAEHRFLAIPVVDEQDRLIGIITADDALDIVEHEATEDIEQLGGSQPLEQPYLSASPFHLARKRIGWLLMLFLAEAYTGTVLRHFEDELQRVVALAFFIPLLIGTGGNTGSQTVTTVIRAMAVGEVTVRDLFRVWRKEVATALMLASAMALATYIRAWTLGATHVGLVVALAAAAIVVWAATVAGMLPLILRRLRIDPAVVSAPLITTLVDGTGLVIYFEIARFLLKL
jgi:magnesium transporter